MELRTPVMITSRLLPGVQVGDATLAIEYDGQTDEGRTQYRWYVDLADGQEFSGNDLCSGCQGGSLQDGLESLLSFLGAAGESANYALSKYGDWSKGEHSDLFPGPVTCWAADHTDELAMLEYELVDGGNGAGKFIVE